MALRGAIRCESRERGQRLTYAELSRRADLKNTAVRDILRSTNAPRLDTAVLIARALGCSLDSMVSGGGMPPRHSEATISIRYQAASLALDERPRPPELPAPWETMPPPHALRGARETFAVRVIDDSADRLYPAGSLVICSPVPAGGAALRLGRRIAARFAARGNTPEELLLGVLDRSSGGDLLLSTRSRNRDVAPVRIIQRAPEQDDSFGPAGNVVALSDAASLYLPRREDPGEILGQVVAAEIVEA